ncbi:MAG: acyl-CoA dehydrogenase family protein [Chloroflexi bacterium]|nr:acyl-CoA dehydrogenase family protein [Chloroflexota bacterium]
MMGLDITDEHRTFRRRLCAFLTQELGSPEAIAAQAPTEHDGYTLEFTRALLRKMGQEGFIGTAWPAPFGGGQDLTFERIFQEEVEYHDAPGASTGTFTYIPFAILDFGTEEQKHLLLPRIRRGECRFFLGYSEPDAGSDLANLQTSALQDGDDFVITGQKVFSSNAHRADFGLVAARTDPQVPKHRGISLFLVDMRSKGISIAQSRTMGGWDHPSVYFEQVRVPATMLFGQRNQGWYHLMGAIDYERAALASPGHALRSFDRLLHYCRTTSREGRPLIEDPLMRQQLAELAVEVEAVRLLTARVFAILAQGGRPDHYASLAVLHKRETVRRIDNVAVRILGMHSQLQPGSRHAPEEGAVEHEYRNNVYFHFAAGGFDITRNVIAARGLGLPR